MLAERERHLDKLATGVSIAEEALFTTGVELADGIEKMAKKIPDVIKGFEEFMEKMKDFSLF